MIFYSCDVKRFLLRLCHTALRRLLNHLPSLFCSSSSLSGLPFFHPQRGPPLPLNGPSHRLTRRPFPPASGQTVAALAEDDVRRQQPQHVRDVHVDAREQHVVAGVGQVNVFVVKHQWRKQCGGDAHVQDKPVQKGKNTYMSLYVN